MFAFSWLAGFSFWVGYVLFGAVTCVLYTRFYAKNTYSFINGDLVKSGNSWYTKDGSFVDISAVYAVLGLSFTIWPIFLLVCMVKLIVKLFFKSVGLAILGLLRTVIKGIPEISITKQDK